MGGFDALALAAGELDAPVADVGVVAFFLLADEVVGARDARGGFDFFTGGVLFAEGDVVEEGVVEEDRVLVHISHQGAQVAQAHVADVGAVEGDAARRGFEEAGDEVHEGGFAGAARAHDGDGLALRDFELDVVEDLAAAFVAEAHALEADALAEAVERFGIFRFADGVLRLEDGVDALHGGEALGDAVGGFGEVFDRLDDAVEDGHVGHEGRGVDDGLLAEDQGAAEPEDDGDHGGAEEFAHGVGAGLPDGHLGVLAAHVFRHASEARVHALLGPEGLDDAQAAEGLFDLAHGVAPVFLRFRGVGFQPASGEADDADHDGREDDDEERQLPGHAEEDEEVDDDQDRVLDQHLDGAGDGGLDLLDVAADAGDDVAFALLAEEAERQGEDLAVDLHAQVLHHAGADGDHHGGGAEVAGYLDEDDRDEDEAEHQQDVALAVLLDELGDVVVGVVGDLVEGHPAVPGDEFVVDVADVEEDLQDRDQQREGEYVEDRRQDVEYDGSSDVPPVRRHVPLQYLPEGFHIAYKYNNILRIQPCPKNAYLWGGKLKCRPLPIIRPKCVSPPRSSWWWR